MPRPGGTVDRGYGAAHKRERRRWQPIVDRGDATCWRCSQPIAAGAPWDLGHDDNDRTQYRGPEHRGRECPEGGNRATQGRKAPELNRWAL